MRIWHDETEVGYPEPCDDGLNIVSTEWAESYAAWCDMQVELYQERVGNLRKEIRRIK